MIGEELIVFVNVVIHHRAMLCVNVLCIAMYCRIIMTSLDERLQDGNYANWLQVAYALKCLKDGLCTVTERMMSEFQEEIRSQNNIVAVCDNESCNSKSVMHEGVDKFDCPKKVCDIFLKSIAAQHRNKGQIFWKNCDVRQWPVKCWEIAKAYMCRGQTSANTEPATTDCAGLLQLISKCKLFQSNMNLNHIAAEEVKLQLLVIIIN